MSRKILLTLAFLCAAGILFAHGSALFRLQERDRAFLVSSPLADLLAEAWLIRGRLHFYEDELPSYAARCYRKAISTEPSFMDSWIELARAEPAEGGEETARRILAMLSTTLAQVSTWKMDELELGMELKDDPSIAACLTYILVHLPHHRQDATRMAAEFWGSWEEVVHHVGPEGWGPLLGELMQTRERQAALMLWEKMQRGPSLPEESSRLRFCQFLLDLGDVRNAREVWCGSKSYGCRGPHDGGLELAPLEAAFGWRLGGNRDVIVERTTEAPFEGNWCLHLRFSGTRNLALGRVLQVIPVESGRTCRLRFARKSRNLSTDQGVFLEVAGYRCDGLRVQSPPLAGSSEWVREELELPVPEGCEAVTLSVRRNESLKLNNKISGDYWLDGVEMD